MFFKRILTLLALSMSLFNLTACSTPVTPSSESSAGMVQTQDDVVDDLEATLEEAVLSLSTNVSDMISSINNMDGPNGTADDKHRQYLNWENKLEILDQRIDDLEDTLDENMKTRKITQDTYRKLDRELHALDELVDSANDQLDLNFDITD